MTANIGRGSRDKPTPNLDWMDDAACKGTDMETFFPHERGPGPGNHANDHAKEWCQGCPVRVACLAYALSFGATSYGMYGVYGGTTRVERGEILKRRKAA